MTRRWLMTSLAGPALLPVVAARAGQSATLDSLLRECARKLDAPGLSATLIQRGKLLWSGACGFADLENRVAASTKSVYRYASISKPLTATMILRLSEAGQLDLDAPAASFCPPLQTLPWSVTARQLLGHLGGIRHHRDRAEALNTVYYSKLSNALAASLPGAQLYEPGTRYLYSTRGYTMLGCMAEQVSAMPFAALIEKQVLGPAGMSRSRLDHPFELVSNRVRGYFRSQNGEIRNAEYQDTSVIAPGGGLCGTTEDLALFGVALLNAQLLSPRTIESMWAQQRTGAGQSTGYGLGWYVAGSGDAFRVWHGGAQSGARGLLLLYPAQQVGVALLTNLEYAELRPTARSLLSHLGTAWHDI